MNVVILRLETEAALQIHILLYYPLGIMNAKCVHSEKCAKNAVYHLRSALKAAWNDT